ncbi:hypothetical protein BHC43_10480 [Snodgrassella alvi]|uniref:hypothetical protein n=1 Tax=Snodgrassella alvi TaxID=1196083 RepID=UPI000C1E377A|nr:hypothetical protein [Snodgrassella alvi]PIT36519.1 hypothetical protein BHC43_10480 [Snodgrassella alvi]
MSTNIIFQIGLYNGVSMLLNNASQIAILQNSHLTNNSKAQQLNQLQLTEILDCCLARAVPALLFSPKRWAKFCTNITTNPTITGWSLQKNCWNLAPFLIP